MLTELLLAIEDGMTSTMRWRWCRCRLQAEQAGDQRKKNYRHDIQGDDVVDEGAHRGCGRQADEVNTGGAAIIATAMYSATRRRSSLTLADRNLKHIERLSTVMCRPGDSC